MKIENNYDDEENANLISMRRILERINGELNKAFHCF